MVKGVVITLSVVLLLALILHGFGPSLHGQGGEGQDRNALIEAFHDQDDNEQAVGEESATISMAQNDDFDLCNDPFFSGIYEVVVENYAAGIEDVTAEILSESIFGFIRAWPAYTQEEREGWVEHIQLIPGQLVEIVREDPTVVQNCDNWSVAMVGPP